ncbi:kinesin-like protein KIN-13A, partial [Tanacetum coccineum]
MHKARKNRKALGFRPLSLDAPRKGAPKAMVTGRGSKVAGRSSKVRKRPLNKKELSRKEDDVVSVSDNGLTVHEPKLKVDLTAYVERHEFCFDAVLDQQVTNDEVYRETVQPIIPIIFQRTKATCFAYGQTDVQIVKQYIERGNACRSTGSTRANEESSRSHAALTVEEVLIQLIMIDKHGIVFWVMDDGFRVPGEFFMFSGE